MADYIPKPGSGTLFKNTRKERENHPDRNGNIYLDDACFEYLSQCRMMDKPMKLDMSGWVKKNAKGEQYISLSVKPAYEPNSQKTAQKAAPAAPIDDLDDSEFPF